MRKFLKGLPFKKVFVFLFVSLYTFLPSLQAFGVVIEDYASEDVSVGVDEGGDILDEGISDPAEIANPNVLEEEVVEEPLFVYEDGVYTVFNVVEGEEYVYPDDEDVRIRFTNVTEEGNLVISKVELTEEEKELLNTSDDYGWDISSSMSNGSFKYDLTLPNNTESNDVEVKYSEDGNTYESIDNEIVNENVIEIKGLEHFTLFVVTGGDDTTGSCKNVTLINPKDGDTCYTTIQAAIDAAISGDDVLVSEGTYTQSLSINKRINLIGAGSSVTTIKPNIVGGAVITVNAVTGPMTIEGFTIDALNYTNESGIYIQNSSSNITVKNNDIINFTENGVHISNGDNNSILDNTITSTYDSNAGVYVDNNSSANLIDSNTITFPTSGSKNLYNIYFAGSFSGNNTISYNILDGGKRSFQQDGGVTGTTTFSNNTINTPSFAGVYLNGGSANIIGNSFMNSVRPIEFSGVNNVTILDNAIDGSTYHGIKIWSYSGDIIINNNSFENIGSNALDNEVTGGKIVDARYNWWGEIDNSGPYDVWEDSSIPNTNPDGKGYGARGYIDYSSWIKADIIIPTTTAPRMYVSHDGGVTFEERTFVTKGDIVRVETEATDNLSGVDYVQFAIMNPSGGYVASYTKIYFPITPAGNTYRFEFTIPTDGKYIDTHGIITEDLNGLIFWVRAYDKAGNYNHGNTETFTYDKTQPTISQPIMLVSKNGGAFVESNVVRSGDLIKIQATANDSSSRIRSVEFRIQDKTTGEYVATRVFEEIPVFGNTYEYTFQIPTDVKYINTHNPISQEYSQLSYWVRAHDIVGNYAHGASNLFTLDMINPSVPLNGTPDDTVISTNDFDFNWDNSSDVTPVTYEFHSSLNPTQVNGVLTTSLWKSGTLPSNKIHSSGAQDGKWYWQVRAKDEAGNYSNWSEIWNVTLDTTPPSKPIITNTTEFTNINAITINWTDGDDQGTNPTGVKGYLFRYVFTPANGGTNINWPSGLVLVGNSKTRSGSFGHGEGKYVMYVQTVDMAGNLSPESDPYTITYDKTKPIIEILGPIENSSHSGSFEIEVRATDESSGLGQFVINIKNSLGDNIGTCVNENQNGTLEHTATCTINTSSYSDGQYSIKTNVRDRAGNISQTLSRSFIFDNDNPTGDIQGIRYTKGDVQSFITNNNTPILYGTCSDNNGVSKVEVKIDDDTQTPACNNGIWASTEFSPLANGTHKITLTVTDLAGNTITKEQNITIDTIAPTAQHTYFNNGVKITDSIAYVKGTSNLTFLAEYSDEGSGIYQDSYVIFDSNEEGTARTSKAYCGWRKPGNTLLITENPLTTPVPFINCSATLPDGEYFMYHQVYDNATRRDIPEINQYRDYKGLHFVVDSVTPTSNIEIQADLNETTNLKHNNGWHGEGWYYNFDNIVLSVDNPEFGDFIQYQILDGEVSTPGGTWTEATDGIDLAAIINAKADGIYTIFWYAEDLAGNTEEVNSEIVKIDRTNPTYTIDFGSINGIADNNVTYIPEDEIRVDVEVGDTLSGYTRARYDLHTADENWNCIFDSSNQDDLVPAENSTTRTLTVSDLSDGRYCLKIWVYDDVQNKSWVDTTGEQWVHFVIDTEFPSTPIGLQRRALDGTIYSCGDYAQLQTLIPDWDDNSDINFDYYEYTSFNANGNIGLDEEILPNSEFVHSWVPTIEGTYGYAVRAVDKAGNKSDWALTGKTLADSCQITYDSTPPVIEPLTQYTYNLSEGDAIPDVQTEVTDETGLKKAYYELTNIDLGTFNDDMDLSGTSEIVDTTGLIETYAKDYFGEDITTIDTYYIPEGVYTIEYYVEDIAGNTSPTETVTINITNVAPIVDSFTADVLNITEGDTVSFEAIFSDPSYIEYISGEKHADDADWTYAFNPEGTYEPELTTNVPGETLSFSHTYNNEGAYLAEFRVCEDSLNDGEGECTTKTVEIVVSNNNPTVTITPATLEVTQGTQAVVLSVNVTNGNAPFTYQWTGDCTGSEDQAIFNPTTAGDYTCTVTVTDADGDTATDSVDITVGAVLGATTENGSTKETFDRTIPVLAYGTGGYLLSQIDEQDTDEEEITEEETTTQDSPEVKGEEDNEEQDGEEEETKWWIYPLVILPVLAIFLILWKRRKEDNEPQF